MMLDVAYVGSSAANLSYQQDINQLLPGTLQANPGVNANALRPYLGYADIYEYMTGANFIYNSLQVQFKKQLVNGGLFNVAYTWSKARTDANGYNYQPMDSYNLRGDWGPSSYNRNHYPGAELRLSTALLAERTGVVQGCLRWLAGFWRDHAANRAALQHHHPDRRGRHRHSSQRPNLTGDWTGSSRTQFSTRRRSRHLRPAPSAIWAPTRSSTRSSTIGMWRLQKTFRLTERVQTAFRAECFNFPNHLSYTSISSTVASSTFGQITGATDPRTMEFALRLSF